MEGVSKNQLEEKKKNSKYWSFIKWKEVQKKELDNQAAESRKYYPHVVQRVNTILSAY